MTIRIESGFLRKILLQMNFCNENTNIFLSRNLFRIHRLLIVSVFSINYLLLEQAE